MDSEASVEVASAVAEPAEDFKIQVIFMEQLNHRKGASRLKHVMAKLFLGKRLLLSDKVDLKCPRCCTRMDNVEKEGVVIDVCPFCQGLFLDDGEIDKLSRMAQQSGFDTLAKKKTSKRKKHSSKHSSKKTTKRKT